MNTGRLAYAGWIGIKKIRFDTIVSKHGWPYRGGRNWRTRVIYDTNLSTSYAAGQWRQLQDAKELRPYWRYRHSHASIDPREIHLSWDGLVLKADDEWWHTHFPPNGWGCKCYVESLTEREAKRAGIGKAPKVEWQQVTVGVRGPSPRSESTPRGINPGFAYAPGRSVYPSANAMQFKLAQSANVPARLSAASNDRLLQNDRLVEALQDSVADFYAGDGPGEVHMQSLTVSLHQAIVDADPKIARAWKRGAALVMTREGANHMARARDGRGRDRTPLSEGAVRELPRKLADPGTNVLLDRTRKVPGLLYIFDSDDPARPGKVVFRHARRGNRFVLVTGYYTTEEAVGRLLRNNKVHTLQGGEDE